MTTPTNEAGHGLPELPAPNKIAHDLLIDLRAAAAIGRPITGDEIHEIEQRMIAALALSSGVPPDMVVMPREATPAMVDAWTVCNGGPAECYRAMVKAAPEHPSTVTHAPLYNSFDEWYDHYDGEGGPKNVEQLARDAWFGAQPQTTTNPAPAADGAQVEEWRCFYCSEVFTDRESAALHFGSGNIFDHKAAGCQIDLAAYRAMEELVSRYQEEDAPIHRQMHRMAGEHAAALRREEERGYARGLRDSGLCPCSTTPQPAAADGGVRERARELLAKAERGPQNDYGTVHRRIAHAAISAALSSHRQAGEPVGEIVEEFRDVGGYTAVVRWEYGDHPGVGTKLYTAPPPGADLSKFRELAERWLAVAKESPRPRVYETYKAFADELMALVEKGAGS